MRYSVCLMLTAAFLLFGCQPQRQTELHSAGLTLSAESLANRQAQSRRFDTADEAFILGAATGVLQDLGFGIDESSGSTGMLVASKERDAIESGQVAGQLLLAGLVAAMGGRADPVWEKDQKIRISVITRTVSQSTVVRVIFQRVIWNTKNQVSRVETISDPLIYQTFFDRLAQSVFLEANQI